MGTLLHRRLWALPFIWCCSGLPSCTKPQDLDFVELEGLRVLRWGLTESELGMQLRLYNPNNQSVQMKEGRAQVYANSAYLGEVEVAGPLTVPRRDTFAIPVALRVSTMGTLAQLIQAAADSLVQIKVEGTVKMGKAGLFRTYPVRYEEAQRLSDLRF